MAKVRDLLNSKAIKEVFTISADSTVTDAARALSKHNVGALVVVQGGKPHGIISERDIVRLAQDGGVQLDRKKVSEVMTENVMVAVPDDEVSYISAIMTRNRVRHLPIMTDGAMVGLVSIGDVVNAMISDTRFENRMLRDYLEGRYPS